MILKELHLTDALGRISIFPPLTHNGEVRILTWPQVIDISKIRDTQIVGTSGLIKFWKLEKILLRTVVVARPYTFLEVRSRDSTWWPDLMWPRHKNFTKDVKLINKRYAKFGTLLPFVFELSSKNHRGGGGGKMTPPPPGRRLNENAKHFAFDLTWWPWGQIFKLHLKDLVQSIAVGFFPPRLFVTEIRRTLPSPPPPHPVEGRDRTRPGRAWA